MRPLGVWVVICLLATLSPLKADAAVVSVLPVELPNSPTVRDDVVFIRDPNGTQTVEILANDSEPIFAPHLAGSAVTAPDVSLISIAAVDNADPSELSAYIDNDNQLVINATVTSTRNTGSETATEPATTPETSSSDTGSQDDSAGVIGGRFVVEYQACWASVCGTATVRVFVGLGACDIVGTDGEDRLVGTDVGEVICALDGDDVVIAGGGDDTIFAGSGADSVDAGAGNDSVVLGDGDDVAELGDGDDYLWGGQGFDFVEGREGNDVLVGGAGDDELRGGLGSNHIFGGIGDDVLIGGSNKDWIWGGNGRDQISSGDGDDVVIAGDDIDDVDSGSGSDVVIGGSGDDVIDSGSGDDFVWGGSGDDEVVSREGNDRIWAGLGNDTVRAGDGNDRIFGGEGTDELYGGAGDDFLDGHTDSTAADSATTSPDRVYDNELYGGEGTDGCVNAAIIEECELDFDPDNAVDSDDDGVPDHLDAFPNDPTEWADSDGDGVGDNADAFPYDPTEWADSDGDRVGDNADVFPHDFSEWLDSDGDGVGDNRDVFPFDPSEQFDFDGDGIGNNADPDDDNDGVADVDDAFPLDPNEFEDSDGGGIGDNADTDNDNDGVTNVDDAFPFDPGEWSDLDGDGVGDNSDPDIDGDGIPNEQDHFPYDPNESLDSDGDGVPDHLDPDRDGDGIKNEEDLWPDDALRSSDTDSDGIDDSHDIDIDGDGVENLYDVFPYDPTEWADSDGDGIGDNSDPDIDGDGVANEQDAFPYDPTEWADSDGDGIGDNHAATDTFALDKQIAALFDEGDIASLGGGIFDSDGDGVIDVLDADPNSAADSRFRVTVGGETGPWASIISKDFIAPDEVIISTSEPGIEIADVAGGPVVDFELAGTNQIFDEARIALPYNSAAVSNPKVLWFNEPIGLWVTAGTDIKVDSAASRVLATVTHFSKFVVVDGAAEPFMVSPQGYATCAADNDVAASGVSVIFVVDVSGSTTNEYLDKGTSIDASDRPSRFGASRRVSVVTNIASTLNATRDNMAVITYAGDTVVEDLSIADTTSTSALREALAETVSRSRAGTDLGAALSTAFTLFDTDPGIGSRRRVVVVVADPHGLTDGVVQVPDNVTLHGVSLRTVAGYGHLARLVRSSGGAIVEAGQDFSSIPARIAEASLTNSNDRDGDMLSDCQEVIGLPDVAGVRWSKDKQGFNTHQPEFWFTSDPDKRDTDGDLIWDSEERQRVEIANLGNRDDYRSVIDSGITVLYKGPGNSRDASLPIKYWPGSGRAEIAGSWSIGPDLSQPGSPELIQRWRKAHLRAFESHERELQELLDASDLTHGQASERIVDLIAQIDYSQSRLDPKRERHAQRCQAAINDPFFAPFQDRIRKNCAVINTIFGDPTPEDNAVFDTKLSEEEWHYLALLEEIDQELQRLNRPDLAPNSAEYVQLKRTKILRDRLLWKLVSINLDPNSSTFFVDRRFDAGLVAWLRDNIDYVTTPVPIRVSLTSSYRVVKLARLDASNNTVSGRFARLKAWTKILRSTLPGQPNFGEHQAEILAASKVQDDGFLAQFGSETSFFTDEQQAAIDLISLAVFTSNTPRRIHSAFCSELQKTYGKSTPAGFYVDSDCVHTLGIGSTTYNEFLTNYDAQISKLSIRFPNMRQTIRSMWADLAMSHRMHDGWVNKFEPSDITWPLGLSAEEAIDEGLFVYLQGFSVGHSPLPGAQIVWSPDPETWPNLITTNDVIAVQLGSELHKYLTGPHTNLDLIKGKFGTNKVASDADLEALLVQLPEPVALRVRAALELGFVADGNELTWSDLQNIARTVGLTVGGVSIFVPQGSFLTLLVTIGRAAAVSMVAIDFIDGDPKSGVLRALAIGVPTSRFAVNTILLKQEIELVNRPLWQASISTSSELPNLLLRLARTNPEIAMLSDLHGLDLEATAQRLNSRSKYVEISPESKRAYLEALFGPMFVTQAGKAVKLKPGTDPADRDEFIEQLKTDLFLAQRSGLDATEFLKWQNFFADTANRKLHLLAYELAGDRAQDPDLLATVAASPCYNEPPHSVSTELCAIRGTSDRYDRLVARFGKYSNDLALALRQIQPHSTLSVEDIVAALTAPNVDAELGKIVGERPEWFTAIAQNASSVNELSQQLDTLTRAFRQHRVFYEIGTDVVADFFKGLNAEQRNTRLAQLVEIASHTHPDNVRGLTQMMTLDWELAHTRLYDSGTLDKELLRDLQTALQTSIDQNTLVETEALYFVAVNRLNPDIIVKEKYADGWRFDHVQKQWKKPNKSPTFPEGFIFSARTTLNQLPWDGTANQRSITLSYTTHRYPVPSLPKNDSTAIGREGESRYLTYLRRDPERKFIKNISIRTTINIDGSEDVTFEIKPDFIVVVTEPDGTKALKYAEVKASRAGQPHIRALTDNQAAFIYALQNGDIINLEASGAGWGKFLELNEVEEQAFFSEIELVSYNFSD